ncbi:MAG TPA: asparagine synthase C-terminal domain-containing protein [Casimicrobiaceae bacterium]|jgi:asparagine synthase (glutamine-hydrolysing)
MALTSGPIHIAVQGHPHWISGDAAIRKPDGLEHFCRRAIEAYLKDDSQFLAEAGGDFSLALVDERTDRITLAIDRIGVRNIVYQHAGDLLIFGATSDVVRVHPRASGTIAPQALYDYVYFHMVPGPATVYREHARLRAGHALTFTQNQAVARRYWQPRFIEPRRGTVDEFKPAFRAALDAGVASLSDGANCGAFLSGGTDSSTIAGLLGAISGAAARTYSIGFSAAGYDEMEYARITARHFGTDHHEYYVTPDDVVSAVPLIASAYDQPFGNASAIPTYYCARLAQADGVTRMLGGDGGDELFGGNTRYAKQYQLALYQRVPAALRRALEPALLGVPGMASMPVLRKLHSYVAQARLPMPARYDTYNLLARLGPENVFDPEFLAEVDTGVPLALLGDEYADAQARTLINRLLALDLKFTLADNDLPKVTRTCDIAGVDVAFPLLHESVVELSAALPASFKVRGSQLRYFFKEALRDFLPQATIAKKKHGFGLPAGLWLRDHPKLRELGGDALASLRRRHICRNDLLDDLMSRRLSEHAAYYGTLAWVLMMLEMWFQAHIDAKSPLRRAEPLAAPAGQRGAAI